MNPTPLNQKDQPMKTQTQEKIAELDSIRVKEYENYTDEKLRSERMHERYSK